MFLSSPGCVCVCLCVCLYVSVSYFLPQSQVLIAYGCDQTVPTPPIPAPAPPKPAWIATGDCPGGHGLAVFEVPAGSVYGCDGCGGGVPAGAAMKGCRVCDVDLCGACCSEGGSGGKDGDADGGGERGEEGEGVEEGEGGDSI
jgi:hypothetical protein